MKITVSGTGYVGPVTDACLADGGNASSRKHQHADGGERIGEKEPGEAHGAEFEYMGIGSK